MTTKNFIFALFGLAAAVCVAAIFTWSGRSDIELHDQSDAFAERAEREVTVGDQVVLTATTAPQPGGVHLFVYNNGDPDDFFQGDESFGDMDKLGVDADIIEDHVNRLGDFQLIASKNDDREQFLVDQQVQLNHLDRHWQVDVHQAGLVDADMRVSVYAHVGKDVFENGGIRSDAEATICEIWKLDSLGGQPVLLDRSLDAFEGLATHAEIPPYEPGIHEGVIGTPVENGMGMGMSVP